MARWCRSRTSVSQYYTWSVVFLLIFVFIHFFAFQQYVSWGGLSLAEVWSSSRKFIVTNIYFLSQDKWFAGAGGTLPMREGLTPSPTPNVTTNETEEAKEDERKKENQAEEEKKATKPRRKNKEGGKQAKEENQGSGSQI